MDPGSYGQGSGYHGQVPVYLNQSSMVHQPHQPHQPVYQSYHQHAPQAPIYFAPLPLPVRRGGLYQQPPVQPRGLSPLQSAAGHIAEQSRGGQFYPHMQNVLAQEQQLSYNVPPPQQFTAPTPQSNLMYTTSPPPPPTALLPASTPPPQAAPRAEQAQSLMSWSAAISQPASVGYSYTNRSTTTPESSPVTYLPPRLKLLHDQYDQYKHSLTLTTAISSHTSNHFLQAASQHGITVEKPETSVSNTTMSWTTSSSEPSIVIPQASKEFDKMKNDNRGGMIDRQDLVDYYVNKHESLGYHKLLHKDQRSQNESFTDINVEHELNSKNSNINNNAKPFVSGDNWNVLNIDNNSDVLNKDNNSDVLNWLSKSKPLELPDDKCSSVCKKVEESIFQDKATKNGSHFDLENEFENPFCRNENLMNQYDKYETNDTETEDTANVNNSYFDDSAEIVIEEHEFLMNSVSTSTFSNDSYTFSYDKADDCDEVDGEMNTRSDDLLKKMGELECAEKETARPKADEVNSDEQTTRPKNSEVSSDDQPVEMSAAEDTLQKKHELAYSISYTYDENIVSRYRQQLEQAENSQIEILTTTSDFVKQVAEKVVKKAVAKGVLKFFSSLKDNYTDFEREFSGDTSERIEGNNFETESTKVLYTWNYASATCSGKISEKIQEKGQTEEMSEDTNVEDALDIEVEPTSEQTVDFEKFFFKQTASRHGITITSPTKTVSCQKLSTGIRKDIEVKNQDNHETAESQIHDIPYTNVFKFSVQYGPQKCNPLHGNQKEAFRFGVKKTEEFDSDIASVEGSQSDSGEAFKMKASERGILVQDPRDRVEASTDSDAEIEQLSLHRNSRRASVDLERRRSTSTPDPFKLLLNPESPEFKPGWKKQKVSGVLRSDAVEFNPESLNSSYSLNTSVSGSEASEKLDVSMRVDAPEFVPVSSKTSSKLRRDTASFGPKNKQQNKPDILLISTVKAMKANPSVAVQVSPDTLSICVGTKRIKTMDSCTATGSCDSRDVSINTETMVDAELEGKKVIVKRGARKLTNKASNTDMTQKRSVGINVRLRNPVKPSMCSVMTMTNPEPFETEKYSNSNLPNIDLIERLKKQDILLESMGKLQIELMLFKEKEIKEEICGMKEDLMKRMTGVLGLFTDSVEAEVLKSIIQSRLSILEASLAEVKSVTSTTISQIQSGTVLEQLPDFGNILPQMSKSPNSHITSPKEQSLDHLPGTSPELSTCKLQFVGCSQKLGTSPVKFQGGSPKLGATLQTTPNTSPFQQLETKSKASLETCSNIPGLCSRLSELPQNDPSSAEPNSPRSDTSKLSIPVGKRTSSPTGKLPLSATDGEFKFPDINIGSLSLSVSEDFSSQLDSHVSKLKSPNHVKSVQRTPVKNSDKLSAERSPTRVISKKSETVNVTDNDVNMETTIAESVKELDDLKKESTVAVNCPYKLKKRVPRAVGFMEIEGSSDEEDVEDSHALVIDKLDDESEETKDFKEAVEQETRVRAASKHGIGMKSKNTITEDFKPELTSRLDILENVFEGNGVNDREDCSETKIAPSSNIKGKQSDRADGHTKDYLKETDKRNDKSIRKTDECVDVNKDIAVFNIADENKKELDENYICSKTGAVDKLISKKMSAEYGKGSEASTSNMNVKSDRVVNDVTNETNDNFENSLDAIDSDENETVKTYKHVDSKTTKNSEDRKTDNIVESSVKEHERIEKDEGDTAVAYVKRTPERLKKTRNDDTHGKMLKRPASSVPPGILDPELNIDPKEVFWSPSRKVMSGMPIEHTDCMKEVAKSAVVELPASETALVARPLSGMPVMLGNINPVLYQAVLAQLIQAYPELASNQEMLTQVAIQQTGILQMYMSNQSGSEHNMNGLGIGSGELQGMVGNICMGQPLSGPDTVNGKDYSKPVYLKSSATADVHTNVTASDNSSAPAQGFLTYPLNSECEAETGKQLKMNNKSGKPPGFSPLSDFSSQEYDVKSCSRKLMVPDISINEDIIRKKETVSEMKAGIEKISKSENEVKPSKSSTGLDDFDLPLAYGADPTSLNRNNNAVSEEVKFYQETQSSFPSDFLPDFTKCHKPENTSTKVIHHFVPKVSDTVSRAIACSDQVNFERSSQSPILTADPAEHEEKDFPLLQKNIQSKQDFWTGNVNKAMTTQKPVAAGACSGKVQMATKTKNYRITQPPNLPPRLRRLSYTDNQPGIIHNQPGVIHNQLCATPSHQENMQQYQVPQQESWDDEVDNYAQTFRLHHDLDKPITMATEKNQEADLTNPFLAPVSKNVPKVKSSTSVTGLCDIPLPKSVEKTDVEKEVEEWQEVQSKRKRHSSKEQKKELRQFSAPYLNSATVNSGNKLKKNNFERLVGRMQQEFPQANKQEVIEAIQKIRVERGTLSGLSMETIIEKGHSFIKPKKKKIPGLWADKKQPVQTLNIAPSSRRQPEAKPVSLLDLKLPPRKPATVGLNKLEIPPRMQHLSAGSETCINTFAEDICVICHDPLNTDPVKELDCMHVFHSQCISQWVERERTCPTCRKHALFPEEFPRLGK